MRTTGTVVIGGGQAGLAVSRCLAEAGHDHVVLERGRLADRWRTERWDSLRLLTPNWMTRLPGWSYRGPDPDGFMTAAEVVQFFEGYAASFGAPIHEGTAVEHVRAHGDRFLVATDAGTWRASNVVIATGAGHEPAVPPWADGLGPHVEQLAASRYRNPDQVAPGGVLVVGAAASAIQVADELARAGRQVVLAAGSHSRMLRRYRGRDIFAWLNETGILATSIDSVPDTERARRAPSMQLVGGMRDLDLGTLAALGVTVTGRMLGADGGRVTFGDNLPGALAASDARLRRTLRRIDHHIARSGLDAEPAAPVEPLSLEPGPRELSLRDSGIRTVVWANGYRRRYDWLAVPVLDARGEIVQRRGCTPHPGLFVVGLRFQTRRNSNFIEGVGADAREIAEAIVRRPASMPIAVPQLAGRAS
jgi:putative flavoprotein involved in K+ transport